METYMKAHGKEGKKLIGDLIDGKTGLCMKEDFQITPWMEKVLFTNKEKNLRLLFLKGLY